MLRLPVRMMIGAISLALLVMLSGVVIAQEREVGPITAAIIERGELICGGNASVAGFGFQDPVSGEFTGFDIDICRAIAAAIL
ncbi:MAG TPA: hypothetical protein PLZ51_16910, partial [Aggregatilineales bacterium]|nr:hypothetical protein [Aggregatilineales bacterium]